MIDSASYKLTNSILQFDQILLPGQVPGEHKFPIVLTPTGVGKVFDRIVKQRAHLLDELSQSGAIIFRGFELEGDTDFDAFVTAFGLESFEYGKSLSNAVRLNRTNRVFTANEAPASVEIYLHHEMAQTPIYPQRLFFFCEKAADWGGYTPLCRSDVLLERLEQRIPEFILQCRNLGVRYKLIMPGTTDPESGQGRSWQDTLGASNTHQAEARLGELSYDWEWLPDECLRVTTPALPLIRRAPNGREVFFNQLIAAFCGWQDHRNEASRSVTFGDGTEIHEKDLIEATRIAYDLVFDMHWETGDVILIDNYLVMHGRRPFKGVRSILASLAGRAI